MCLQTRHTHNTIAPCISLLRKHDTSRLFSPRRLVSWKLVPIMQIGENDLCDLHSDLICPTCGLFLVWGDSRPVLVYRSEKMAKSCLTRLGSGNATGQRTLLVFGTGRVLKPVSDADRCELLRVVHQSAIWPFFLFSLGIRTHGLKGGCDLISDLI